MSMKGTHKVGERLTHDVKAMGESATKQAMKEDTDINVLATRFGASMFNSSPRATRQPMFGDFTYTSMDLLSMKNAVADAENRFLQLPGRIRKRFGNDQYQFLRFVENPENYEECVKMGLVKPRKVAEPEGQEKLPLEKKEPEKAPEAVKPDPEANPQFAKGGVRPRVP